ncbi:MFS transporter [Nocardia sp. BMG51109]|uniref:MFS transporter n=1 Tax=Nocardia sp. BMG51109 TaxID=1056816 RepID=UPI0004677992|nr:MFS transporter [Nocardia sp. BMG51109]
MTKTHGGGVTNGSAIGALIVTGIGVFMVGLDNLVVTNALPVIQRDLNAGLEGLEWTVNAYTLPFAAFLLTGAAVADRFGRKRLLLGGLVVFVGASAACASAGTIGELIAARAVQGVGAAVVMPLTLTMLSAAVSPERRTLAIGGWSAMSGLAAALGPVVGGVVTELASWQWIFWINVPIGAVLIPMTYLLLAESHGPAKKLDLVGTALASIGLAAVVYGVIRGNGDGWTSVNVLSALVAGGVCLVAFVGYEIILDNREGADPMMPMRLFLIRGFSATNAAYLIMGFAMFGAIFLIVQFLQNVQGYSPLEAGVRSLPWTAAPVVVAPLAGLLTGWIAARTVVVWGLVLQTIGIGWLAAIAVPDVAYTSLVPAFVVCGAGMGLFFPPMFGLVLANAPERFAGVASGVSNSMRQLGTVLGIAVLGSVFSAAGSLTSRQGFVDGMVPALWVATAALAVGSVVAVLIPARPLAAEEPVAAPGSVVVR